MEYLVLGFFQLILNVFFKLILDIDKSLKIFEIFLEKSFEVEPHNKNSAFIIMLVLNLFKANNTMQK